MAIKPLDCLGQAKAKAKGLEMILNDKLRVIFKDKKVTASFFIFTRSCKKNGFLIHRKNKFLVFFSKLTTFSKGPLHNELLTS